MLLREIVLFTYCDSYFLARSAWSRAEKPVMEIGDLSEKEAKDYLIKMCTIKEEKKGKIIRTECKINDEQVNEIYKLVGGRIVDLKVVVIKFLAGHSLKGKINFIFISNEIMQLCFLLALFLQSSNNKSLIQFMVILRQQE